MLVPGGVCDSRCHSKGVVAPGFGLLLSADQEHLLLPVQPARCAERKLTLGLGVAQGRSGQAAKRRWRLMLKCVPEPYDREFDEIVDYLVEAHAPYLRAIPAPEEQTDSEDDPGQST